MLIKLRVEEIEVIHCFVFILNRILRAIAFNTIKEPAFLITLKIWFFLPGCQPLI